MSNFNQRKIGDRDYLLKPVTDFEKAQRILQDEQEAQERKQ